MTQTNPNRDRSCGCSGLPDDRSLSEALTRGAALGAFCVSTFGDYQGLPDRGTLETFIAGKQTDPDWKGVACNAGP